MKCVTLRNMYVEDLEGLYQDLQKNSFSVTSVSTDGFQTNVYLHDHERKDPSRLIKEWASKSEHNETAKSKKNLITYPESSPIRTPPFSPQQLPVLPQGKMEMPGTLFGRSEPEDSYSERTSGKQLSLWEKVKLFFSNRVR